MGVKFSFCKTVCRDVVNFPSGESEHSVASNKVRPADGRGAREEMAGHTSASDAPSALAELATQSMPKKVAMRIPGRVFARLVFVRKKGS